MRYINFIFIFAIFIETTQPVFPDWTMEHLNAQNDRRVMSIKLPLKERWKKQYYGGAGPVLMNGRLYILKDEEPLLFGKIKLIVLELDRNTGQILKKHVIGEVDKLKYRRMMGYQGKLYVSTVWLDLEYKKEKLFVNLWAYDVKKETVVWKFDKITPFPYGNAEEIGAWINATQGMLFLALMEIHESDKLFCFDAATGKLLWSTSKPEKAGLRNSYPVIENRRVFRENPKLS